MADKEQRDALLDRITDILVSGEMRTERLSDDELLEMVRELKANLQKAETAMKAKQDWFYTEMGGGNHLPIIPNGERSVYLEIAYIKRGKYVQKQPGFWNQELGFHIYGEMDERHCKIIAFAYLRAEAPLSDFRYYWISKFEETDNFFDRETGYSGKRLEHPDGYRIDTEDCATGPDGLVIEIDDDYPVGFYEDWIEYCKHVLYKHFKGTRDESNPA